MQEREQPIINTEVEQSVLAPLIISWFERNIDNTTGTEDIEMPDGIPPELDERLRSGEILDLNSAQDEVQVQALIAWMEAKLGTPLEEADVLRTLENEEQDTVIKIFASNFGSEDDPWYLSQWDIKGKKSSYLLQAEYMYDQQTEQEQNIPGVYHEKE